MAATVTIQRETGPGTPTNTPITNTNTRCNACDQALSSETISPVIIPDSGLFNYSFWCSVFCLCEVAPITLCDNFVWYTDGSNGLGTGRQLLAQKTAHYREATGVIGVSGDQLSMANHDGLPAEPVDAFSFTIGSPMTLSGSMANIGDECQHVVFQHKIADNCPPGAGSQETFSFFFDET